MIDSVDKVVCLDWEIMDTRLGGRLSDVNVVQYYGDEASLELVKILAKEAFKRKLWDKYVLTN